MHCHIISGLCVTAGGVLCRIGTTMESRSCSGSPGSFSRKPFSLE